MISLENAFQGRRNGPRPCPSWCSGGISAATCVDLTYGYSVIMLESYISSRVVNQLFIDLDFFVCGNSVLG